MLTISEEGPWHSFSIIVMPGLCRRVPMSMLSLSPINSLLFDQAPRHVPAAATSQTPNRVSMTAI